MYLVLDNGGSLKAEHGTGRVMAPFVRRQYGDELYDVMRTVKRLVDPRGLLNPGVLLSDDPQAHLRHIKLAPQVEAEVDRCVECGYCEPVCPSRDLTLTPRQRIVLRRDIRSAELAGDTAMARAARARLRVPRGGHLRGRRHVRHGLPGRDQHGPAGQDAAPREPACAGPGGVDCGCPPLGGATTKVASHRPDRRRSGARPARACCATAARRVPCWAPTPCRSGPPTCPAAARPVVGPRPCRRPTPSTCRPAST